MDQITSKNCIKSSWMQVDKILLSRDRPEQFPSFLYEVFNGIKPLWDEAAFSKLIIFLKYQRIVWLACYFTVFMILKTAFHMHVGAKRLPDWLRNNLVSSPKAFSLIIQFEGVELTRGIFPWSRTILSTGLLDTRLTRKVRFRFVRLPSRFDKIRVPQKNIGIYQDHAFLIPNLKTTMRVPRVKQDWHESAVCGGPHRFAQDGQPSWCAEESKSRSLRQRKKRF